VFARILPWLEPTRYDKTLKQFANYHELWADTEGKKRPVRAKASAGLGPAHWVVSAVKAHSQRLLSAITLDS
jgi:hypothetical protein